MNTALLSGLRKILKEYGTGTFDNIKFVGSALGANAAAIAQPEYDVLMLCLMAGYHKELTGADETVRDSVKKSIAERLHNNEGIDADLCNNTLDVLEAVFFKNEPAADKKVSESDTPQISPVEEKTELAAAKIEELQTIIADYKEENARLAEKITRITKQKKQNRNEKPVLEEGIKKTRNKFITSLVFLVISVIAIFVVYYTMNEQNTFLLNKNYLLENETFTLEEQYEDEIAALEEQHEDEIVALKKQYGNRITTLEKQYENSKKIWAINVTDMKAGNAYLYDQWITRPGSPLKASDVRYLNPVFTYNSPVTSSLTFYIKIKDSAGTVVRGNSSPEGFSYSSQYQVKRGTSLSFDPGGFGTSQGGFYSSGRWTIELWLEDFCLYSGEVKLN